MFMYTSSRTSSARSSEEFINNGGPGDSVVNELQGLWELKMMQAGAVFGPIDRSSMQKAAPGGPITPNPVHDLNVPYEGTEEYETPMADLLFTLVSFQISNYMLQPLPGTAQTPLPGTADNSSYYNIPTGGTPITPNEYSSASDNGGVPEMRGGAGRPSPYMIQAIGLQVVKVILHKGSSAEFNNFSIFFVGELVGDLFIIIQKILEKPINREAVAIAMECLKILMLLQTLSKANEYRKELVNLLLEAVLMITTDGSLSQEANELRSAVVKLVSQLAQIPSSAAYIKDILLAMPAIRRQQLQDLIRASVTQGQNPTPPTSSLPPLVIKFPSQTQENKEKSPSPLAAPKESDDITKEEEEDDDWDAFQSFPASKQII